MLSVHNEGPAISKEDLKYLFTQYHRTEAALQSEQRGWGIGLSLVKGLTQGHGGSVSVESVEGKGTTFTVRLPLHKKN